MASGRIDRHKSLDQNIGEMPGKDLVVAYRNSRVGPGCRSLFARRVREELIARIHDSICRKAVKRIFDPSQREYFFLWALSKVWDELPMYEPRPDKTFEAWLHTVLSHAATDWNRANRITQVSIDYSLERLASEDAAGPQDLEVLNSLACFQYPEDEAVLNDVLDLVGREFGPTGRRALELKLLDPQLNYTDVAAILDDEGVVGTTPRAVSKLFREIRALFRESEHWRGLCPCSP